MSEEIRKQFTEEEIADQERRFTAFHKKLLDPDFANSCADIIEQNGNLYEFLKSNGVELTDEDLDLILNLLDMRRKSKITEDDLEALKNGELTENMLAQVSGGASAEERAKNINTAATWVSSIGGLATACCAGFPPAAIVVGVITVITSIFLTIFGSLAENDAKKEAKQKATDRGNAVTSTSKF